VKGKPLPLINADDTDQKEIAVIARNRRDRKDKSKTFTTEGAEEKRSFWLISARVKGL
jgi:hypothetical protein